MKKVNDDFMGKVKEFFRPTKEKIWTFAVLELVALISIYFSFRLVDPAATPAWLESIQSVLYVILFVVPAFLVNFLGTFPSRAIFMIVFQAFYIYLLSCIIVYLYTNLRGLNINEKI